MDGFKSFLASKTVWGGIITGLGVVLGLFGHTFTADDQAGAITAISAIMDSVGAILAIYGRVTATKMIGSP